MRHFIENVFDNNEAHGLDKHYDNILITLILLFKKKGSNDNLT